MYWLQSKEPDQLFPDGQQDNREKHRNIASSRLYNFQYTSDKDVRRITVFITKDFVQFLPQICISPEKMFRPFKSAMQLLLPTLENQRFWTNFDILKSFFRLFESTFAVLQIVSNGIETTRDGIFMLDHPFLIVFPIMILKNISLCISLSTAKSSHKKKINIKYHTNW